MGLLMEPVKAPTKVEPMEAATSSKVSEKVQTMALMTEPKRALRVSGKAQTKESLKAALTS